MSVLRIVANVASSNPERIGAFYTALFDMSPVMDHGWIVTLQGADARRQPPQISVASEGGSGTPVPAVSIEVDDLDEVHARAVAQGIAIEYGPVTEPWGVTRIYLRDPAGTLINVLTHTPQDRPI